MNICDDLVVLYFKYLVIPFLQYHRVLQQLNSLLAAAVNTLLLLIHNFISIY